jgi:hypothetical protein
MKQVLYKYLHLFPQGKLGVIHVDSQYYVYMAPWTMLVVSMVLYPFFHLYSIMCVLICLAMVIHHISHKGFLWTSWITY